MILRASYFDLHFSHKRGNPAGCIPIHIVHQAIQQPGPVSISAAGRINQTVSPGRRDVKVFGAGINDGTRRTAGHNQRFHQVHDTGRSQACLVFDQLPFIIIEYQPGRILEAAQQFIPGKYRYILAGVKDKRDVCPGKLPGVLQHPFLAVRRHDTDTNPLGHGYPVFMRMCHGAYLERCNLVIIQVRSDKTLRGICIVNDSQVAQIDVVLFQPFPVCCKISPHRTHRQTVRVQQFHIIDYIAAATAELALHVGHHEANVQHVNFIRQYVVLKTPGKHHDVIIGEGTADECSHKAGIF